MMKGSPIFLSLILLSIIQCLNSVDSLPEEPHDSMRLELIHRHDPRRNARPKTQLESMKELLHNDIIRVNMISHKLGLSQKPRRQAWETSTSNNDAILPMYSGHEYNVRDAYFATFKVGTPSQTFELLVDTGSDLTWVNCKYQSKYHKRSECGDAKCENHRRVFLADSSSSFKPIPYKSRMCQIDLKEYGTGYNDKPKSPCPYGVSYLDDSTAKGFLAKEILTLPLANGGEAKLDAVIGCSSSYVGAFGAERLDGILGLAYSNFSFVSKYNERFGGKFSYCLVDHWSPKNVSNHLILGTNYNKQSLLSNMSYTKLLNGVYHAVLYRVNVRGISIDGVMLNIPSKAWMEYGFGPATFIDSGTTASILREPAYSIVTNALMKPLSNFTRVTIEGWPLECFNSTGFKESMVPRLAYHFDDGAIFEPLVKGYVIDLEEQEGVRCIGFALGSRVNLIGNRMQQNYLWEYDVKGHKLGFAPSTCT